MYRFPVSTHIHSKLAIKTAAIPCSAAHCASFLLLFFVVYRISIVPSMTHRMLSHLALVLCLQQGYLILLRTPIGAIRRCKCYITETCLWLPCQRRSDTEGNGGGEDSNVTWEWRWGPHAMAEITQSSEAAIACFVATTEIHF
jgi:hypothetical protein